jgi:hypothetical protein
MKKMLGCLGLVKRRNTLKKIDQPTPWLTYSPIRDYKMEYVIHRLHSVYIYMIPWQIERVPAY